MQEMTRLHLPLPPQKLIPTHPPLSAETMARLVPVTETPLEMAADILTLHHRVGIVTSLETRFAAGVHATGRRGLILGIRSAFVLESGRAVVVLDLIRTLDPLQRETSVNVPDDVAMHQPCAWVVSLEADDSVAWRGPWATRARQHSGITSSRIVEVEGRHERWIPGNGALAKNRHVVAMQMHGMGSKELVLDDKVHPLVLRGQGDVIADSRV